MSCNHYTTAMIDLILINRRIFNPLRTKQTNITVFFVNTKDCFALLALLEKCCDDKMG